VRFKERLEELDERLIKVVERFVKVVERLVKLDERPVELIGRLKTSNGGGLPVREPVYALWLHRFRHHPEVLLCIRKRSVQKPLDRRLETGLDSRFVSGG
jgi:hypothetical protein